MHDYLIKETIPIQVRLVYKVCVMNGAINSVLQRVVCHGLLDPLRTRGGGAMVKNQRAKPQFIISTVAKKCFEATFG